ncbi:MAG: NAD(P)/FAD-dependent oxidoreductase, partial [Pseudomonadota bacterium]
WKERLCLLPDGDLFAAIRSGKASVCTDEIDAFVAEGIRLKSGDLLEADVIVAATGIELCGLGDIAFSIDGTAVALPETFTYRGIMVSGMPNLAWSFGYIRTSWTMRSDMIAHYVCRLLNHMDEIGMRQCTPTLRQADVGMNAKAYIDPDDFAPGYMRRGTHRLPKQSDAAPWTNSQDYYLEKDEIPAADLQDDVLRYSNPKPEDTRAA